MDEDYIEIYNAMLGNYNTYDELDWDDIVGNYATITRVNRLLQTMYDNLERLGNMVENLDIANPTELQRLADAIVDDNNEIADIYESHTMVNDDNEPIVNGRRTNGWTSFFDT